MTLVPEHWFREIGDYLGEAYLRYSFTYGTKQEVDFLIANLALEPEARILDVGCGPGRHSHELARRGYSVVGIDICQTFVELAERDAPVGAEFECIDILDFTRPAYFDAVISLCQGAFGLAGLSPREGKTGDPDGEVLAAIVRTLRPGGRLALTAFSSYFQICLPQGTEQFDADSGLNYERTEIKNSSGSVRSVEMWTSCFTPRELRLLAQTVGLTVNNIWSVSPGKYEEQEPNLSSPEYLLLGEKSL